MAETSRQILLKARPRGLPAAGDFELREGPVPEPGEGEFVIRNRYLSLDPAIRGWMDDTPSYMPPIGLGEVMRGTTVGEVVASRHPDYQPGDQVVGLHGWEDYSLGHGAGFDAKIPAELGLPPTWFLSVLGAPGMTAYFGFLDVGRPQAGETVLVSAAAGAVGSLVGQIAKIKGCTTIGIAGGPEKCSMLKDEFGYDHAIDYKAGGDLASAIRAAAPEGVDIVFENVGGEMLDAALMNLKLRARVLICGLIAGYNAESPTPGPRNLWQLLVKRARMEGLLVADYVDRFPEGITQMGEWLQQGRIRHREHVEPGLVAAPQTFLKLFDGSNMGKLIVDLAADRG